MSAVARAIPTSRGRKNVPRVGYEPDLRERLDERRIRRRDDEVARERHVRSRSGRDTIHGADHGLVELPERPHDRVVAARYNVAEVRCRPLFRRHLREILPGAERSAGARHENGSHAGVGARLSERLSHFGRHRAIEAIQDVRTVERNRRDALTRVVENVLEWHDAPDRYNRKGPL
jgi:hypothetical protein